MKPFHETPPSGPTADLAASMQALIPTLETERLILRAPRIEDFDAFAEMTSGPRSRYFGDREDRAGAWDDFMQITATWLLRGHGAWTATMRDTGEVVGFVLIGAEPGDMEPELGFVVSEAAEGHGIAFEACEAVREHALGPFALPSLVSYIDAGNVRSRRLAERLGAERDGVAEAAFGADAPLVYRHPTDVRPTSDRRHADGSLTTGGHRR